MNRIVRIIAFLLFGALLCDIKSNAASSNILLICVDDLRPELGCFGTDYIQSPRIGALASQGRVFRSHYVQAPTCGASRHTLLTGRYGGTVIMHYFSVRWRCGGSASLPAWFRSHGTQQFLSEKCLITQVDLVANWNDSNELEMPESWNRHLLPAGGGSTLVDGCMDLPTVKSEVMPKTWMFFSLLKDQTQCIRVISVSEGVRQLTELATAGKPFFLAIGILRPHLPFGAPAKYLRPYSDVVLPPIPHPEGPIGDDGISLVSS